MLIRSKKMLTGVFLLLVVPAVLYLVFPGYVYDLYLKYERSRAGVSLKSIKVEDQNIVYLEGGEGETVLLLHGFGGDKYNWVRFAKYLTSRYHVIIPDLPGFGESTKNEKFSYSVGPQVERLNKFIEVLNLKKIHIAGNSMGGYFSGMIAARYNEKILSLNLIDAAGVHSPVKSDFLSGLDNNKNELIIDKTADFNRMMSFVFFMPVYIPSAIKEIFAVNAVNGKSFNEKVFKELLSDFYGLESKLNEIRCPTMIIWGDADRILDVSCAGVFEKGIKNHRSVILKNCGHVPMLERPEEAAMLYLKFLDDLK